MINRFYLPVDFSQKEQKLLEEEHKHAKVMRLQKGDNISLINGKGALAKAVVISVEKNATHLKVHSVSFAEKPPYETSLVVGILKQNRLEILVEKAVEIGIDHIYFFPADFSEKKQLPSERLERISVSAVKQSGRLFLPKITLLSSIEEMPTHAEALYYGSPKTTNRPPSPKAASLFYIGPEKGFSPKEEAFLERKATPVCLGTFTLRAETAGILAAGFLQEGKILG